MRFTHWLLALLVLIALPACSDTPGSWDNLHSGHAKEDINGYIGPY